MAAGSRDPEEVAEPENVAEHVELRGHSEVRDTPAEVDAAFRTLRRVAVTYFVVFLAVVAAFPLLTMTLDWWSESRLIGALSPGFLTAGVGLYVVFAVIGIAAATLSSTVESRMLGRQKDGP